jgi:hypothetical protein
MAGGVGAQEDKHHNRWSCSLSHARSFLVACKIILNDFTEFLKALRTLSMEEARRDREARPIAPKAHDKSMSPLILRILKEIAL